MKRSDLEGILYTEMLNPPKEISSMNDGGQQAYIMMRHLINKMEDLGIDFEFEEE